jgi:ABC-type Fe3+-siderophore transport system permease subunit
MKTKLQKLKFEKRVIVSWFLLALFVTLAMEVSGRHYMTGYDVSIGAFAALVLMAYYTYLINKEKAKVQP